MLRKVQGGTSPEADNVAILKPGQVEGLGSLRWSKGNEMPIRAAEDGEMFVNFPGNITTPIARCNPELPGIIQRGGNGGNGMRFGIVRGNGKEPKWEEKEKKQGDAHGARTGGNGPPHAARLTSGRSNVEKGRYQISFA